MTAFSAPVARDDAHHLEAWGPAALWLYDAALDLGADASVECLTPHRT